MTGNIPYLSDFEELNGGYVTFGGNPKGGKISGIGKIKTGKIDFDDVYFVKELNFNFFSVSQMCDKKNSVLFTNTECPVLSPDFKLPDEIVTDDYSRFTWVFFLATKDKTSPILKTFITGLENQLSLKVKVIRSDNGTEFKNNDLNQFYGMKGIKREFSVPRTPQQNGIAERKNRTLIKAARTMLADSLLPIPFWAEAVNTAYSLGKFDGKVDKGFLVGYSVSSKAFRVFNGRTRIVQETLHVNFLENEPNVAGSGPTWLFDIDSLTKTMNYQPVTAENQSNPSVAFQDQFDAEKVGEEGDQQYVLFPVCSAQSKKQDYKTKREAKGKSHVESFTGYRDLSAEFKDYSEDIINEVNAAHTQVLTVGKISPNNTNTFSAGGPSNAAASPTHGKSSFIDASQLPDDPDMQNWRTLPILMMKMMLVHSFLSQEEPRKVHQALKAYASFMGFMVYQIDYKSAFLYGTIKEEVYVCQPPGFEDPDHPNKRQDRLNTVYQKEEGGYFAGSDLYGKSASTPIDTEKPLLKDPDGEDVDVHTYRSMISSLMYLTSSRPDIMFATSYQNSSDSPLSGVNIPRSDEDRLELIELTVLFLPKVKKVRFGVSVVDLQVSAVRLMLLLLVHKLLLFSLTNWCCSLSAVRSSSKGFYGVKTPLFEGMLVEQHVAKEGDAEVHGEERVKKLERRNKVKVLKLRRLQKVRTAQRVETSDETVMDDVSNQGRMIAEMDQYADVVLEDDKKVADEAKEVADAAKDGHSVDNHERKVESQSEIYKIDLDHANKFLSMQEDETKPAEVQEAKFNTNVDFLMKTKEQIEQEENIALKRLNETLAEKAAKRQKLDEEVHLQIVPNEDDNVYTEATPLAQKVLLLIIRSL
nr:hypothetical protein [Tanacetum cinerariifolium]